MDVNVLVNECSRSSSGLKGEGEGGFVYKRNLHVVVLLVLCMVAAGCQSALLGTMRENKEREQHIIQKQGELEYLNEQNQRFVQEQERLSSEKEKLEAELEDEKGRLTAIDADLKSLERKGGKNKKTVSAQILKYKEDIKLLKSSVKGKEKQLEQLKKQSELYLEMGLDE